MAVRRKKSTVSFGRYSNLRGHHPHPPQDEGRLNRKALAGKGQIFLSSSFINDSGRKKTRDAEMAINIIREVYYSHPSNDIVSSLNRAFQDANLLINELINDRDQENRFGVKCTAFVLTRERGYLAQVGDNHLYRISEKKIERLTSDTNIVGGTESFALGLEEKINVHFNRYIALRPGDIYLMCSESLSEIHPAIVRKIALTNTPVNACRRLAELILQNSPRARLSIQVIRVNAALQRHAGIPAAITAKSNLWLSTVLVVLLGVTTLFLLSDKKAPVTKPILEISSAPPQKPVPDEATQENQPELVVTEIVDTPPIPEKEEQQVQEITSQPVSTRVSAPRDLPGEETRSLKDTTLPSPTKSVRAKWNLQNLTDLDYEISADKISFLSTPNIKKALYRGPPLNNFTINLAAQIRNNSSTGRFGIIVGYQTMADSPYEVYYLLSLFRQREFLLQRYSGFRKELVTRIPITLDNLIDGYNNLNLEIKCSGPFIELQADNKQVFRWRTGEETVTGNVGVFVSPETEVEISKFEVIDRSDLTKK